MIQLNLLPDVKLEYIKAQRTRRLVISASLVITTIAVLILVLLLGVDLAQKKHLSDLSHDINSESSQLQQKPDISKILTVQNQLESLTALHSAKPAASRLFTTYLDEVTPGPIAITSFQIDFTQHTTTITGTADALSTVNKYVDTLKFTKYTTGDNSNQTSAFSNVVLTSFGLDGSGAQAASYTITLSYDPIIFDITQNVTLVVPSITTTRSQLAQPGDLFKTNPNANTQNNGGTH